MDNQHPQPAILIQNQYIKDLSMEIPHAPQIFKKLQQNAPKVNVEVNIEAQKLEEEKRDKYNPDNIFKNNKRIQTDS